METLDLLEELIAGYPGTVLLVSHDRDFLDRTVTGVISPQDDGVWLEYAGGYSDMLAQKRDAAAARKPAKPAAPGRQNAGKTPAASGSGGGGGSSATGSANAAKLSYKQKFALETLPKTIAELEAAIAKAETEMADPQLFSKKPDRFQQLAKLVEDKRAALAKAEDEWLELEMLKAEMEG